MTGDGGISRRSLVIAGATFGASSRLAAQDRSLETVEIADSETATIDGRFWDKPMVGGKTVDAVHRSVLLRFPAMAEPIAAKLAKGYAIDRADLLLAYDGYEIVPPEYTCRVGLGQKLWTENPPTWHIQVWPLRRPWIADPVLGPTFNASVNGRRYWSRYGASDERGDRYSGKLEPQELSIGKPEARVDISRLLLTDVLAQEPGLRLRVLEQCGFLLRKIETYDFALPGFRRCLRMGDADRRSRVAICLAASRRRLQAAGQGGVRRRSRCRSRCRAMSSVDRMTMVLRPPFCCRPNKPSNGRDWR